MMGMQTSRRSRFYPLLSGRWEHKTQRETPTLHMQGQTFVLHGRAGECKAVAERPLLRFEREGYGIFSIVRCFICNRHFNTCGVLCFVLVHAEKLCISWPFLIDFEDLDYAWRISFHICDGFDSRRR